MKKIALAVMVLVFAVAAGYAADRTIASSLEPIGAAIEVTGVFVGNLVGIITGQEEAVKVSNESGVTKVFGLDPAVTIVDAALNVVTLNQLKSGEKVKVEYLKDKSGSEKAKSIQVVK